MARTRKPTGASPGRPRLDEDSKRAPLVVTVSPDLRNRIVALADENGRSLSRQTEYLLLQALDAARLGRIEEKLDRLIARKRQA
jgi:hypothetical protein